MGNKKKLINKGLIDKFPDNISVFVDVFAGSSIVSMNVKVEKYIVNDSDSNLVKLYELFKNNNAIDIINHINSCIDEYGLARERTSHKTFDDDRVERYKLAYVNFRNSYNSNPNVLDFYTLMFYSFSQQFRFNNNHEYNSSFGKNRSYFSERQRQDLIAMKNKISTDIAVMSKSFEDIDFSDFDENDLVYLDPPYYNSVGSYNDGKRGFEGWTKEHEIKLLDLMTRLHKQETRFALSNNLKYDNLYLREWLDDNDFYTIHYLKGDYVNCNYHKIDRSKDIEVLITNY